MRKEPFGWSCFPRFTLIELLVVIAIIAILASMLLPSLKNAQRAGQKASCQNQIKQLSMVMEIYTDDYDQTYMLTFPADSIMWTERLVNWGYVKNPKAYYYCSAFDNTLTYRWYPGYGYVSPYLNTIQGKKRSRTEKPDQTAIFSEINVMDNSGDPWLYTLTTVNDRTGCWTMKGVGNFGYGYLQRHGDGDNFVFCDGHAEYLPNPYRLTCQLKGLIAPYRAGFPFTIP